MNSGALFLLLWVVILGVLVWVGYRGLQNNRLKSAGVLGIGIPLFILLCAMCLWRHGPSSASDSAPTVVIPTAALAAPDLAARLLDGNVILTGTLPDQETKNKVLARAKELYGEGKFVDNLEISNSRALPNADWVPKALTLLPLATQANNEGGIALDAKSVTVKGLVDSDEAKAKLIAEATKNAGANIAVIDNVLVKGKITAAQTADFQARLNQMIAGKIVEFETGKDIITPRGKEILDQMVQVLGQVPGIPVEVSGHTDARGAAAMNVDLSQRRAAACRKYLIEKGVAGERLSAKGYGANKPIADNNTPEGLQKNRRIEFTVVKEAK